jgi:hypothetical protein
MRLCCSRYVQLLMYRVITNDVSDHINLLVINPIKRCTSITSETVWKYESSTCLPFINVIQRRSIIGRRLYGIVDITCMLDKRRDNSDGIATVGWKIGVRMPAGAGNFFLRHRVQTGSGAHPAS